MSKSKNLCQAFKIAVNAVDTRFFFFTDEDKICGNSDMVLQNYAENVMGDERIFYQKWKQKGHFVSEREIGDVH